jgi:hypothetical protein
MILFAVSDPSKYELLIDALLRAIDSNPKKKEDYEQLIDECNRSLSTRSTIPLVGNRLYREGDPSQNISGSTSERSESIRTNNEAGNYAIQRIPAFMDSARSRHIHYKASEQPAGYDYVRNAY